MSEIIHAPSVGLWIPAASAETMRRGVAREQNEQACIDAAAIVHAPPCPACGRPVSDAEWERHRRVDHADHEVCQPAGQPDARELLLLAYDADDMARKLARWRSLHPGIRLEGVGEGTREQGKIIWRRWRIFDGHGQAAT